MNSVSKRALAGLSFLALTAASCGSVESVGGSAAPETDNTTSMPAEAEFSDTGNDETGTDTTAGESADVAATNTTEAMEDSDVDDGAPTTEATTTTEPDDVDETTTSSTTAPSDLIRTPDQRVLTTEDLAAVGITVESSWSVPPEAASQAVTCGVAAPGVDGRITQVFQTPSGAMIAQYVQEGVTVADQWMTSLAALDGCVESGVSPMRLGKGEAPSATQTLVLDANGSDDDGGYMAVVGGRKGDLVTGFMTVSTDPEDLALSSETLLQLLEVAIAD